MQRKIKNDPVSRYQHLQDERQKQQLRRKQRLTSATSTGAASGLLKTSTSGAVAAQGLKSPVNGTAQSATKRHPGPQAPAIPQPPATQQLPRATSAQHPKHKNNKSKHRTQPSKTHRPEPFAVVLDSAPSMLNLQMPYGDDETDTRIYQTQFQKEYSRFSLEHNN